jgi:hypothetical protein
LDCINHTTGENIWFVPYYELVRKYAGETVTGNITTAKQIQAYNTMEALIKQYNQHKKLAQNNKNNTNTIARFRIVDDKGNVLYRWTNAK